MSDIKSHNSGDITTGAQYGITAQVSPTGMTPRPTPHLLSRPRVWPAILIALAMWSAIYLPEQLEAPAMAVFMTKIFAPMVSGLFIGLWWLFASRVRLGDKLFILVCCITLGVGTYFVMHPTFQMGLTMYGLPWLITVWAGWLALTPFLVWPVRRLGLLVGFLVVYGTCASIRMDGVDGSFSPELSLRWSKSPEDLALEDMAKQQGAPAQGEAAPAQPITLKSGDWPGFRGPNRDAIVTGFRLNTDWEKHPPRELWTKTVGLGWSSFAVVGDRLYTQEQRKNDELVVCYHTDTGAERWVHKDTDEERFTEPVAGAGPRATPTFHAGKIYALGAKGMLNCLDAATGKVIWSKNAMEASGAKLPTWAFSASPLVARGIVSVYLGEPKKGNPDNKAIVAYKADTGDLAWTAGKATHSYCSTQLARINGVEVILVNTEAGMTVLDPATGKVLREVDWAMEKTMARVIQPAVVSDNEVLIGSGFGIGTRRLKLIASPSGDWSDEEVWTSKAISPYYNDLVIYKNHLYGFDSGSVTFFTCVSLSDGSSKWRARGYGAGQVLLFQEQGLLVILSEKGDLSLVQATPENHTVLGKIPAIKGKTWNHAAFAHGKLFVRNGRQMSCFELTPETK